MKEYIVSPNPHIHADVSTSGLMRDVIIALTPAILVSVAFYGWAELLVLAVSAFSCVALEWAICKWLLKMPSRFSGSSALLTGLLLAMNLPVTISWWIVVIGAVVAIGIAKMSFGGLGQNMFNPAITARVFLLVSFPQQMTNWELTEGFIRTDAVSGATLLGRYAEAGKHSIDGINAVSGTDYLHTLFLNIGGSAGEISAIALLVGFAYLLIRKVVKIWIPLSIFGTVALISLCFWLYDPASFTDPVFNLLTGGMILGACFMATDYVTSPMSDLGGVIYGFGIGLIVMMIRYFGAYPEGMSFAILIMNCCVPLINRWCHQRKFGRA